MWLAGLLEGEGCFYLGHHKVPALQVHMTDRDVVERAASLLGNKATAQPKRAGRKQAWSVSLYGHRAVEWMRLLLPHMGERRSTRITELLAGWDAVEHKMPKGSGLRSPAKCHPDRPVVGGGLCQTCYMREYRQGRRVRAGSLVAA